MSGIIPSSAASWVAFCQRFEDAIKRTIQRCVPNARVVFEDVQPEDDAAAPVEGVSPVAAALEQVRQAVPDVVVGEKEWLPQAEDVGLSLWQAEDRPAAPSEPERKVNFREFI